MSRALAFLMISMSLVACGDIPEQGPKSRSNERPIQREIERRLRPAESPPTPIDAPIAIAPAAPTPAAPARAAAPAAVPTPAPTPASAPAAALAAAPTAPTAPAPAAVPAAPEAPAPAVPAPGEITVTRVVATSAIENREPAGEPRADADRTFAFVEAANRSSAATELSVVFIDPEGARGRAISLSLPVTRRWRTWATTRHTHGRTGRWTIVVTDASGAELSRQPFDVAAAAGDAA